MKIPFNSEDDKPLRVPRVTVRALLHLVAIRRKVVAPWVLLGADSTSAHGQNFI